MNHIKHKIGILFRRNHCMQLVAASLLLSTSSTVQAIPSPDLVINLSASVAQLLGLLSVVFGGFAMSAGKRKKSKSTGKVARVVLLGVSVLLIAAVAGNVLQYTGSIDAKNSRLHTNLVRKSVENGSAVGDTSLKTLSFSEQLEHPQGISTETLAEWLSSGEQLNVIDVREDEEYEMGSIDGAIHLRYPDVLAQSSLLAENSNTLFLCYSGNRSSELCTEFTKQGKSCNFMMGGYEKWLTESRPLSSDTVISIDDLRQLPDFQNKDTLLDTPEVRELVQTENAEFIDVRYPGDFVKNHLPGAYNITMRALSSAPLAERIAALPDTPLIAACYDKRSCFYSQLIGLRLERAGKDFRGRYTVPHEFYTPKTGEPAHLADWKQSQDQLTLASYVVTPLRAMLDKLVDFTGHYALGLLAIVLLVRLLLLPLSLKSERDTLVQKSLGEQIKALKDEFKDHPRALSEATMELYKRYKIRPVVNMLTSVFQLSLMLLFYSAVSQSAGTWSHTFLWLPSALQADPYLIFPMLASALFIGVLAVQSPPKTTRKIALLVLAGSGLFWLLQSLSAAVNLYLGISMAFLIGQSYFFKWIGNRMGWSTAGEPKQHHVEDTGLVPLSQAHYLPESTGKKAARLGQLIEAGFNVPDGFVFTSVITNRTRPGEQSARLLSSAQAKTLARLWRQLKTDSVAVRSSGANEDGADNSFAGVYESILNVSRDELITAVRSVYASLVSDRSDAYTRHTADNPEEIDANGDEGGVVVQKMVPAEYAGVMFTEHPGTTGAMMVEMVTGLGEELVSGNVTPDTFAFGKVTGAVLVEESSTDQAPPIDIQPLLQLGRELEALFGHPQDIEWAYAKGTFYLLQARDITRSVANGSSLKNLGENERHKLLACVANSPKTRSKRKPEIDADAKIFVQNELSELLPRPTPLSADFMEKLWAAGGSTDLACQELGIPYNVNFSSVPYINTIFGWTYVNKQEEQRRLGKGPGAMAAFQLSRNAEAMEEEFRDVFLPHFQAEMLERNAVAMDKLSISSAIDILGNWVSRFVEDTYRHAELINISADYHTKTALTKLQAKELEPTLYLNNHEETVVSRAISLLNADTVSRENVEEFLLIFGHRAPLDYELSTPRFNEDMNLVRQYIERSSTQAKPHEQNVVELPEQRVLAISIERARRFQNLKEEAKHYCLIELAQIRKLLLAIDRMCDLDGRIFQLTIDEVLCLADATQRAQLQSIADKRLQAAMAWQSIQLPTTLSLNDLERIDMLTGKRPDCTVQTDMSGKRVAGEQEVTGRARVITDVSQIDEFQNGEILIARMTDPTWYPLFSQARGIVTEVGGWLSHAAIVAREYDLPAIVGVEGICQSINTGDVVKLKLDGSVDILENRRSTESPLRENTGLPLTNIDSADAVESQIVNVYQLSAHKLNVIHRTTERRAIKNQLGDRRNTPRMLVNGDLQPDRRAANMSATLAAMRKKAS